MSEEKLIITTEKSFPEIAPDIVFIALKGFIDAYTYGKLEQAINNLFDQKQYKIVIDMSEVEYIASTGAGILINAMGKAQENQGKIVLVRPQPKVMEIFNLLGLDQILTIANSVSSALKAFI